MAEAPSPSALKEMYREVMDNDEVTAVSNWRLHNTDEPTDENEYVANAERIAPTLFPVIEAAIKKIK